MATYEVTQTVHFTFRVEADSPEQAEELSLQLGYDDAYESYAESIGEENVWEVSEDLE
jgi:hypothetical protein